MASAVNPARPGLLDAAGAATVPSDGLLRWHVQPASRGAGPDLDWAMDALTSYRSRAAEQSTTQRPSDEGADLIRLYIPEPTVAFGQRDTRLPGYPEAVAAVRDHGFTPLVRRAGGRAAAYHHGCVVVDHLRLEADAALGQQGRFPEFADLFVRAFARMDVPASVGEIPGEYCPGEFSVQGPAPGYPVKLAGSAQRVVKGAWLFSTHVVVADSAPLRAVLTDVYQALGMDMDPRTVGAADDVRPGSAVAGFIPALRAEYTDWAGRHGLALTDLTV